MTDRAVEQLVSRLCLGVPGEVVLCQCDDLGLREQLLQRVRRIQQPSAIEVNLGRVVGDRIALHIAAQAAVYATRVSMESEKLSVHATHLEELPVATWHKALRRFQFHRDEFREPIRGMAPPLIALWVTTPLLNDIGLSAPDFESYCERVAFSPKGVPQLEEVKAATDGASAEDTHRAFFVNPMISPAPEDADRLDGWIHSVLGRSVELYFPDDSHGEIVTTSVEYFLPLAIDLKQGTPISLLSWQEDGTELFQYRGSAENKAADARSAARYEQPPTPPADWNDATEVETYLERLARHFGETRNVP